MFGFSAAGRVTDYRTLSHLCRFWHYILKEAEQAGGEHMGPVGGRIVTEVFIGLLYGDPQSYVNVLPFWTPQTETTLRVAESETFELSDIIGIAGMPLNKDALPFE